MRRYNIADLIVDISFKGELLESRSEKYKTENILGDADICIDIDPKLIEKRAKGSSIGYDGYEYLMTGSKFYRELLKFDGFMLHASAVVLDGKAYLFSAPSGTGKSTHTALWEKYFNGSDVYVINDDKPAIKLEADGEFYVYGTPWSGKSDKNANKKAKLQGICFIERSEENFIEKINPLDALQKLVWQTIRPSDTESLDKLITLNDMLLKKVSVYKMGCRIDTEAVELAYSTMK